MCSFYRILLLHKRRTMKSTYGQFRMTFVSTRSQYLEDHLGTSSIPVLPSIMAHWLNPEVTTTLGSQVY